MTIQRGFNYLRQAVNYVFLTFFLLDLFLLLLTIYWQLSLEAYEAQYRLGYGYAFGFVLLPGIALFIAYSVGMISYRGSWADIRLKDRVFVYAAWMLAAVLVCNVLYFISLRLPIW